MAYSTQAFAQPGGFSFRRFIAGLLVVMLVVMVAAAAVVLSPLSTNARALTFHSSVVDRGSMVTLAPGTTGSVTLRFRNAGLTPWERGVAGAQVDLGVKGDSLEFAKAGMAVGWLSDNRIVTMTEPIVPPGADATFTLSVRAPTTLGLYRIPVRLVVNNVTWLDDQDTFVTVASDFGFHGELVDQSRHPTLRVGETSGPITVKLRNTGTRAWVRGNSGQQMNLGLEDNDAKLKALAIGWPSADRVAIQSESTVSPGDAATFAFRVRAPSTPGTYALRLRPVVDGVTWLEGDDVISLITVTGASGQAAAQTGSASFTSTASVTDQSVSAGAPATITVSFRSASAASALLGIEIYAPGGGSLAYQHWFDEQSFAAGEQRVFPVVWQVPANAVLGTYSVSLRAFAPGWKSMYSSKDGAATLSVAAPVQAALPTAAPGGNTPTAAPSGAGQGQTGPTPTPAPSAVPSFTSSASVNPASVILGSSINVSASFTSASAMNALVSISIYPPSGAIAVHQQSFDNQAFAAGQARSYAVPWSAPADAATGPYRVSLGVFSPGYGTQYSWNDSAATFAVGPVPASPTPTAAPTPTASLTTAPTATPTNVPTASPTTSPLWVSVNNTAFLFAGTWSTSTGTGRYLDDDRYSDVVGSTFSITFAGTSARLYAAAASHHGIGAVSVDGGPESDVDFYSATRLEQALVYATPTLASAVHTITVRVTGRKNTASTGFVVVADRADLVGAVVTPPSTPTPVPTPTPTVGPTPSPTAPPSSPPPSSGVCPSPAYARLVNVATPSQLVNAVNAANPGDMIVLAPGTYAMSAMFTVSRSGTSAQPIQVVGPRNAILDFGGASVYHFLDLRANWWIFAGFTHQHSFYGPTLTNANNNVLCDLLVEHMGQEAVNLKGSSSYNTVQDSTLRETGEVAWYYAEAFYIGDGGSSAQPANFNRILRNHIGPNVRSDHFDVKGGTQGNLIEGNVSDATGFRYTDGSDNSAGQVTSAVFSAQGLNQTWRNNTIINLNSPRAAAFQDWQGSGMTYHGNTATGTFRVGFDISGGSGNVVGCDNTIVGGPFANVPCQ